MSTDKDILHPQSLVIPFNIALKLVKMEKVNVIWYTNQNMNRGCSYLEGGIYFDEGRKIVRWPIELCGWSP